jgi:cysteinyl-tRNA synthetase
MADIYLTNSLTRTKEKFTSIVPEKVGFYTCGPTVYSFATIGNFRTYTTADILNRVLKYNGYDVTYIMNITDVGHLTGDNEGDADTGEDRMEKAAKREQKDIWEIAKMYTDSFLKEYKLLNLLPPQQFTKATDHIKEQISLIEDLEKKGFTYITHDGVYFDTKAFEEKTGKIYGELSTLDQIKEGARVEANPEKKNPRDFALWKFSPKNEKRQMEWESPWGVGFPGWHIECSAMSMKYLGETFDIHAGGEDLQSTHHPNEIAQSEAANSEVYLSYV